MKIDKKKWTQFITIIMAIVFEKIFYKLVGISLCIKRMSISKQLMISIIVLLGAMHIFSFCIYRLIKFFCPTFWLQENKSKHDSIM